ncbi:hypothetical protein ScPMuIL_013517 [Solemya velum]
MVSPDAVAVFMLCIRKVVRSTCLGLNNGTYLVIYPVSALNRTYTEYDDMLGSCGDSTYYVTVTIPDVDCENCYLKLSFIDIDHASNLPCRPPESQCKVFESCANIRIRPTENGKGQRLDTCEGYGQTLDQTWPYKPLEVYKAQLVLESQAETLAFTYDVLQNSLHYDIPIVGMKKVENCTIYFEPETPLFLTPILDEAYVTGSIAGTWRNLTEQAIQKLRKEELNIELNLGYEQVHGVIKFVKKLFEENMYYANAAHYSKQGWLKDKDFVGSLATASNFLLPAGPCAPTTRKYITALETNVPSRSEVGSGVMGMMFVDTRVHIWATFVGLSSKIESIVLSGPELAGVPALDVPVSLSNGTLSVVLDVPTQVKYIGKMNFFKKVTVKTRNYPDGELTGKIEEGTMAVIRNKNDKVCGMAVFKLTQGRQLAYSVALSSCGGSSSVSAVTLNRRARTGMLGSFLHNIRQNDNMNLKNSSWFGSGFMKGISSKTFLYLWAELLYINVEMEGIQPNSREVSGQVLTPGEHFCAVYMPSACPVTYLKLPDDEESNPPFGIASFIIDRSNVIQYSILMMNLASNEKIVSANVMLNKRILFTINKPSFSSFELMDNSYIASNKILEPSPDQLESLSQGKLSVQIFTTESTFRHISGHISAIHKESCMQDNLVLTVGEGQGLWGIKEAPFPKSGLHIVIGDTLKFIYTGNNTVYLLKDQRHFEDCNLTDAKLLSVAIKLQVTVISKPTGRERMSLSACETSVYQLWREATLSQYKGPNMEGTAIGAIVAATLILAVILVWDRKRNKFKETHSESFQKF